METSSKEKLFLDNSQLIEDCQTQVKTIKMSQLTDFVLKKMSGIHSKNSFVLSPGWKKHYPSSS